MPPTIVVYGPMACGKTRNAVTIAEQFSIPAKNIVDDWHDRMQVKSGYLHLTNAPVDLRKLPSYVQVIQFASLGLTPPKP